MKKSVTRSSGVHRPRFDDPRRWLALTLLSSLLAGCVTSTASSVGRQAVDAAMQGRLDAFRSQLAPAALSTLGTPAAMDAIRGRVAGYTNVSVGDAVMKSAQQGTRGHDRRGDVLRTYEAPLSGSPSKGAPVELIYTLQLQCVLSYGVHQHDGADESCSTMIERTDVPWTNCTPGAPVNDSTDRSEVCALTGIKVPSGN